MRTQGANEPKNPKSAKQTHPPDWRVRGAVSLRNWLQLVRPAAETLTPTSHKIYIEKLLFLDPETIDVGGLDGPGGRPDLQNR